MSELSTPEQVAEQLQVSTRTVRAWLRNGELVGIKIGKSWRIHPDDIHRLLDGQLLTVRLERARKSYPNLIWQRGYCRECGKLIPEPKSGVGDFWVCSSACQNEYDLKAAAVVGRGTEEFAGCSATVIPPF
jgi:excisionase family DNA binding protein